LIDAAMRNARPQAKSSFVQAPDHRLLHDVGLPARRHHAVVGGEVAVDEQPVARHLDVVEDHECVLLVEAAREREIEAVVRRRHRIATEELQPRRADGYAEGERIFVRALGQRRAGIDRDLVGEGRQGRQHPRAAHDDAVLGLADLAQGMGVAGRGRIARRLVDRGLDDRVGERHVTAPQELLIGDQPLDAGLVAVRAPFVGPAGEPRVGDVHVVGRAAHQADRIFRHLPQRPMATGEIFPRPRDQVADRDRLAGLRVRREAGRGLSVVEIVDLRQRMGRAAELGMVDDIGNLLAVDPDIARAAKPLQELFTRPCRHCSPPRTRTVTPPASSPQEAAASRPCRTRPRA
jgi:hypothetical protein